MFQWGNKTGARENTAGQGTVQRLGPGWGHCCDLSLARTETPLSHAQERPVSPPGRGRVCQLGTGVNKSFSRLSSCLTFIPESPGRPGSPSAPGGPCKKKSLVSPGTRDGPALQESKGPERARDTLRSHNREDRTGLRAAASESWQNRGCWCRLAEPHTTQQLLGLLPAHECGFTTQEPLADIQGKSMICVGTKLLSVGRGPSAGWGSVHDSVPGAVSKAAGRKATQEALRSHPAL